jgi:hypothetical protein
LLGLQNVNLSVIQQGSGYGDEKTTSNSHSSFGPCYPSLSALTAALKTGPLLRAPPLIQPSMLISSSKKEAKSRESELSVSGNSTVELKVGLKVEPRMNTESSSELAMRVAESKLGWLVDINGRDATDEAALDAKLDCGSETRLGVLEVVLDSSGQVQTGKTVSWALDKLATCFGT